MDVSSEYVTMCDCPEIQGLRQTPKWMGTYYSPDNWEVGDYFALDELVLLKGDTEVSPTYHYGTASVTYNGEDIFDSYEGKRVIWLPTQSQLQDMVADEIDWSQDFFAFWYEFFGDEDNPCGACLLMPGWAAGIKESIIHGVMQFSSWEQLWLAFVMKSLYQKSWNGSGWV